MNLVLDMSNEAYHGGQGLSSSKLKSLIEDPEIFYKKYISKEIGKESSPAFDMGTYFHTAILEPEKLLVDCIVWRGGVRRGSAWEEFQKQNSGKAIITSKEVETANVIINAVKRSITAMELINACQKEVSVFVPLFVSQSDIFVKLEGSKPLILTNVGWRKYFSNKLPENCIEVLGKARADAINLEEKYILDLKSTTGNCRDVTEIKNKVSNFSYDLSAAFYLDLFSAATGSNFQKFYWTFSSKDLGNCQTYLGDSEMIKVGRAKWSKAVIEYARMERLCWDFSKDDCVVIGPAYWDKDWTTRNTNFLV